MNDTLNFLMGLTLVIAYVCLCLAVITARFKGRDWKTVRVAWWTMTLAPVMASATVAGIPMPLGVFLVLSLAYGIIDELAPFLAWFPLWNICSFGLTLLLTAVLINRKTKKRDMKRAQDAVDTN